MSIKLQRVRVANGYDEEGLLVLAEDRLVAVLVRLSDHHREMAGRWFWRRHLADFPAQITPLSRTSRRLKTTSHRT